MDRDADDAWDQDIRKETPTERLDRNWADLMQEVRVVQTGVQLLTGLLLTVPFQARFGDLTGQQRTLYLVTLALAVIPLALLVAPVATHRLLFRRHARASMVASGQRFAIAGLATLGLAVVGVVTLIFDVVVGTTWAIVAAAVAAVLFGTLWGAVPLYQRRGTHGPGR